MKRASLYNSVTYTRIVPGSNIKYEFVSKFVLKCRHRNRCTIPNTYLAKKNVRCHQASHTPWQTWIKSWTISRIHQLPEDRYTGETQSSNKLILSFSMYALPFQVLSTLVSITNNLPMFTINLLLSLSLSDAIPFNICTPHVQGKCSWGVLYPPDEF